MPFYDYKCKECEHIWEEQQTIDARNVPRYSPCPKCGTSENIILVIGKPAFVDPVSLGIKKPDSDVVNRINKIKNDYGNRAGDSLKNFRY